MKQSSRRRKALLNFANDQLSAARRLLRPHLVPTGTPGPKRHACRLAALMSRRACVSSSCNWSGVIDEPAFANDGGRQGSNDVRRAGIEVRATPGDNVRRIAHCPEFAIDRAAAKQFLRSIVGNYNAEIQVAIGAGVSTRGGAETIDALGVVVLDESPRQHRPALDRWWAPSEPPPSRFPQAVNHPL